MADELSFDDLNGGLLGVEYLLLDLDYAMSLQVEHDGQPEDAGVSLIRGPEAEKSRLIEAYVGQHRDELVLLRLECRRCGAVEYREDRTVCETCGSRLERIHGDDAWLRGQAYNRLVWELPAFQARRTVPKWIVEKLYEGQGPPPADLVIPLSLVFNQIVDQVQRAKTRYVRTCWEHLYVGKSASNLTPQGKTLAEKHRSYMRIRGKLVAGYNWLTGIARQYPEFMDDCEQHKCIRTFPPAVMPERSCVFQVVGVNPQPEDGTRKKGGRPLSRERDDLLALYKEMKVADPRVTQKDVVGKYNQRYGAPM